MAPKKNLQVGRPEGDLRIWRRERDSNPRYVAVYTISSRAPSTTRPPLQQAAYINAIRLDCQLNIPENPKNGRWNTEMPLMPGTVEAFVPDNFEA